MSSVWRYQASRLYGTAHSKGTSTGENGRAWKRQVMKNYCRRYPLTAILLSLFAALLTTGNRYCRCSAFDVQKSSSISNGGDPHKFLAVSRLRFASRSRRSRGLDIALAMRGGGLPRGKLSADKKQVSGEAAALSSCAVGGKFRDAVFPIYGSREVGKFLALAGIQFFIIFVLTLTRDLKDTLIITSCGAEAISFLKVGRVLRHPKPDLMFACSLCCGMSSLTKHDARCSASWYKQHKLDSQHKMQRGLSATAARGFVPP